MTLQDQKENFKKFTEKQEEILLQKGDDYATEDRMSNFKLAAAITGLTAEQICLAVIGIKLARLGVLTKGKTPKNESIEDTIIDTANYYFLLDCIRKDCKEDLFLRKRFNEYETKMLDDLQKAGVNINRMILDNEQKDYNKSLYTEWEKNELISKPIRTKLDQLKFDIDYLITRDLGGFTDDIENLKYLGFKEDRYLWVKYVDDYVITVDSVENKIRLQKGIRLITSSFYEQKDLFSESLLKIIKEI
jgi:hypothetical protein